MSQLYIFPPGFSSASPNGSVGPNGAAIPTESTLIGGKSPTSTLLPVAVDASGHIIIEPLTTSSVVKAQLQDNSGAAVLLGQALMATSLPVAIASDQSTLPVSDAVLEAASADLNDPSPAKALQIGVVSQGGNLVPILLGQAIADESIPVIMASDQSELPINITEISGAVPSATNALPSQLTDGSSFYDARQIRTLTSSDEVSADGVFNTSLPTLSNGQASPLQLDSNARLIIAPLTNSSIVKAQLQDNSGTAITLGQKVANSSIPVVIASNQPQISVTDASLDQSISSVTGGSESANAVMIGVMKSTSPQHIFLGQAAMADSLPVAIASNQGNLPIAAQAGRSQANAPARNDYSSVNVTTSAYVTLVNSTSLDINQIDIFDSSGQTLVIATGGVSSEVDQFYVFPGGNGPVPIHIAAGTRLSIKAVSATANSGSIALNFWT